MEFNYKVFSHNHNYNNFTKPQKTFPASTTNIFTNIFDSTTKFFTNCKHQLQIVYQLHRNEDQLQLFRDLSNTTANNFHFRINSKTFVG